MPETAGRQDKGGIAALDETGRASAGGERDQAAHHSTTDRLYFSLGIGVQTLLWFLLFLALVVAVAVGGELTEFRYVGF